MVIRLHKNQLMTRSKSTLLYAGCVLAVLGYRYTGLILSLADFHPGGDVPLDPDLTRTANLGVAMGKPFQIPLEWMQSVAVSFAGGYDYVSSPAYTTLYRVAHWVLLPLMYGTMLFICARFALSRVWRVHTHAQRCNNQS